MDVDGDDDTHFGERCSDSDTDSGVSVLELHTPEPHVAFMLRLVHGLLFGYLICTSISFCSSRYTLASSAVDAVAAGADAATLDIASAGMFCAGFFASYLHSSLPPAEFARLSAQALLFGLLPSFALLCCVALLFGPLPCFALICCAVLLFGPLPYFALICCAVLLFGQLPCFAALRCCQRTH